MSDFVGTAGDDSITGTVGADSISGLAGNDMLDGAGGADTLEGGTGDDAYYVDSTSDVVVENLGEGADTVFSTATAYTLAANVEDLTFTGSGDFSGAGNDLANTLTGGSGNDILIGGDGADALHGAGGVNTASYINATASVVASLANPASNTGEAAGDTYANIQNLTGGAYADTLSGDNQNNVLSGGGGADLLIGGSGADTLDGGSGTDTASYAEAAGAVRVDLSNLANNTGEAAGDSYSSIEIFQGSAYADTLISAGGIDSVFRGGTGNDAYSVDSASDVVIENAGEGADTVYSTATTYTLAANVEDLTFTGSGDFSGAGNASANNLTGGSGNDILIGGDGADALDGAGGVNTASYINATAGLVASLVNPASNTGEAAGDTHANIQNLTGSAFADTLGGDSQANVLSGGGGADLLIGGSGADTLDGGSGTDTASYANAMAAVTIDLSHLASNAGEAAGDSYSSIEAFQGSVYSDTLISAVGIDSVFRGGAGDDTYTVDSASDAVVENPGEGADTVLSTATSYTLAGNLEVLTFTATGNFTGVGNAIDNTITGGSGNDTLVGAAGADQLDGAGGVNAASYFNATSAVFASLAGPGSNTGDAAGDTYVGIQNLTGSAYADTLVGDAQDNTLIGGAGADALDGGSGSNTASYATAAAAVLASLLNSTSNTGEASGDTFTNILNLAGSVHDDTLIGDAQNNTLFGDAGDDEIIGNGGADILSGGAGNNTASYVNATSAIVANLADPTANTGEAIGDTYLDIQNLIGSAYNDTLIGDGQNNILMGGLGGDRLEGAGGNNTASYARATTAVVANLGNSSVNTAEAAKDLYSNIQNITGGAYNDTLTGDTQNNILKGGGGDDLLNGQTGSDILDGGTGTNTATYINASTGVIASLANAAMNTGEAAGDTYFNIQNLTGGILSDTLIGDAQNNVLNGGASTGTDTLIGGLGADTLIGNDGSDTASYIYATSAVTVDLANITNNTGEAAGDTYSSIEQFQGSAFNDTFIAPAGLSATLRGGAGDDVYRVASATTVITENAAEGTDWVYASSATYTLGSNLEVLAYSGSGNFFGTGNALANTLIGGLGNDLLAGGGGLDVYDGGGGNNTVTYGTAGALVASLSNPLVNTGDAGGDIYINIQNLTGGILGDTLVGDAGDNVLDGGASIADDVLIGGLGADRLIGNDGVDTASYAFATSAVKVDVSNPANNSGEAAGDTYVTVEQFQGSNYNDIFVSATNLNTTFKGGIGDDVYYTDASGDLVVEKAGEGTEVIYTTAPEYTLPVNVENLTYTGTAAFWGTANNLANVITGGSGGHNTVSYAGSGALTVNLANPSANTGWAAGDTYVNIQNIIGGISNDILIGDDQDNILDGGGSIADDILIGGLGADRLVGGDGTDTASYANATAAVKVDVGHAANGAGEGAGDTFTSIEVFQGSIYNDTMISATGVTTTFRGGAGDDVYQTDSTADLVVENAGNGVDTINTTSPGYALPANVENLTYIGAGNFTGTGSISDDTITGGAGNDVLIGGGGADVLDGAGGVNTASYSIATGAVTASLGAPGANSGQAAGDTYINIQNLIGGGGADLLSGDAQNNTIAGGGGADTLSGGLGLDALQGDAGNDVYDFNSVAESGATWSNCDLIFGWAAGDKIDLSSIDADTTTGGDQAFHLDGTSGSAGDVVFYYLGGYTSTFIDIYVDNDAIVDMTIAVVADVTFTAASFIF